MTEPTKAHGITGYRVLTDEEKATINMIKEKSIEIGQLIDIMEQSDAADQRWVAIAKSHLQQGFMAAVRSIAQPTTF